MKNFIKPLVLALVIVLGFGVAPQAHAEYVNQKDIDILNQVYSKVNNFNSVFDSPSSTVADVQTAAATAEGSLDELANHSFSTGLGSTYTAKANEVKTAATDLKSKLAAVVASATSENSTTYESDLTAYNQSLNDFDSAVKAVDASIEESNTQGGLLYMVALISTAVLTVASLVWSLMKKPFQPEQITRAKRQVFIASLWPLIGAGITYGSYYFADSMGGSYTIAWGAIVIGLVLFIRAIIEYVKVAKTVQQMPSPVGPSVPPVQPPQVG